MEGTGPFRWDVGGAAIARRMGRGLRSTLPPSLRTNLLECAAKVLCAAGEADLVFVGRSPESIHDFLAGALARTSRRDRLQLLQLSLRDDPRLLESESPGSLERLRAYFESARLTPQGILERPRPVAFVDLVCSGDTFGNLAQLLRQYDEDLVDAVRERLRWVCIVSDDYGWRTGHSRWTRAFAPEQIRRVTIDDDFWDFLGDEQEKTTESYSPDRWGSAEPKPALDECFAAVRQARAIYRLGECWRRRLAGWLRSLGRDLLESERERLRTLAHELSPRKQ
jgi:hypothetical protein